MHYLKSKGGGFTVADKRVVEGIQRDILKGIIPFYKELADAGTIELSTSPFYHPIIPLLIDTSVARETMPGVLLPEKQFSRPEDASRQITGAAGYSVTYSGSRLKECGLPRGQ